MKGLLAVVGMLITVGVLAVCAVVELFLKLWPLLVVAGGIWITIKIWQTWRRKRREDRGHIEAPWLWEHAAPGPVVGPLIAPPPPPAAGVGAAAPAVAVPGVVGGLPPVMAHQDRSFVVRGNDTGLLGDRDDGYLSVSAHELPRVPRLPASHQHRPSAGMRRASGRRAVRRRP